MDWYSTHTQDPNVRAADADRDATGERLRRHHAEGRIDAEEFQERIDRCYHARTIGELRQLVNDLPREYSDHSEPRLGLRRLWPVPLVPILIAFWVISSVGGWHDGWHHGPWGLFWLIPVLFLVRFVLWPYGRWGARRRYRFPRDL